MLSSAALLNYFFKGQNLETILEIPELLWPKWNVLGKKIWIRIKSFIISGGLSMIYAIGLAAILYESGFLIYLGNIIEPLITGWLRLPAEVATPLILGVFRRELTVLPLLEMDLTFLQLFIAALVGLFYVPCIAVFAILKKEFNLKVTGFILILTMSVSFFLGGIFARIGGFFI